MIATTTVASKAARSEMESGFQTQGGMPSAFSHECGISPFTSARCPLGVRRRFGASGRSTDRVVR